MFPHAAQGHLLWFGTIGIALFTCLDYGLKIVANNSKASGFGGLITPAIFLRRVGVVNDQRLPGWQASL